MKQSRFSDGQIIASRLTGLAQERKGLRPASSRTDQEHDSSQQKNEWRD